MKKISLKASIAAVSLSLALTPLGFAQSPAATKAQQAAADTQPLPGARVASQFFENGTLTTLGAAVVGVTALTLIAATLAAGNSDNSAFLAALAAANLTVANGTITGTR